MDKKLLIAAGIIILIVAIIVGAIVLILGGGLLVLLWGVSVPNGSGGGPVCLGTTSNMQVSHIVYDPNWVAIDVKNLTSDSIENIEINIAGDSSGIITEQTIEAGGSKTYNVEGTFDGSYEIVVNIKYMDSITAWHYETARCKGYI